jgi:hypothetical protein
MDEKGIGKNEPVVLQELDENGFLATVYEGTSSGDLSLRQATGSSTFAEIRKNGEVLQSLINVFLPTGYPHSVSGDYLDYQIYDTIQAFSSSIVGLFANRAVLGAVGVGDDSATSTSALFMKILQDSVGRLGTILFAWRLGSTLEPECKKYRFVADLVNDTAYLFDCFTTLFPASKRVKVFCMCMSGALRSICGVMAGGSRAALTQHFTDPVKGSIADVNAKDQSQETVITLLGMLTGSFVVGFVSSEGSQMWLTVLSLLCVHLWTNYQAVAHVVARTLNRQRANIVFSDIVNALPEIEQTYAADADSARAMSRLLLTPKRTCLKERILETDGLLRWYPTTGSDAIVGHAKYGSFKTMMELVPPSISIAELLEACDSKTSGYVLFYQVLRHSGRVNIRICLTNDSNITFNPDIRAWVHALLLARKLHAGARKTNQVFTHPLDAISESRTTVIKLFDELHIEDALQKAGWELERNSVQSSPNPSIKISHIEELKNV